MNLSGLLSTLTLGTQAYKVDRMKKIYTWIPYRKMICVGDSTQSDPEAYGEIYRRYPGWIRLIFIRKVTDIAKDNMKEKNEPSRFEKAFEGVPTDVWYVFESPEECYQRINDVVGGDP
jgi:phosphatidate phosphatase APP1